MIVYIFDVEIISFIFLINQKDDIPFFSTNNLLYDWFIRDGLEKNLLQELSSKSLNQDQVQNIHKTFDLNKDEVLDRAEQLVLSYSLDRFLFQNKYQMKVFSLFFSDFFSFDLFIFGIPLFFFMKI